MDKKLKKELVDIRNSVYETLMDLADEHDESRQKVLVDFNKMFNAMVQDILEN